MTKEKAVDFFRKHAKKHGVEDYSFSFITSKRKLGSCNVNKKEISLSLWHLQGSTDESVKDTILHEIAHALAFKTHGPSSLGHGHQWVQACLKVGAKPERTKNNAYTIKRPPSKYTLVCEKCGKEYPKHRMPKGARYACGRCNTELKVIKHW